MAERHPRARRTQAKAGPQADLRRLWPGSGSAEVRLEPVKTRSRPAEARPGPVRIGRALRAGKSDVLLVKKSRFVAISRRAAPL